MEPGTWSSKTLKFKFKFTLRKSTVTKNVNNRHRMPFLCHLYTAVRGGVNNEKLLASGRCSYFVMSKKLSKGFKNI